ncbi:MAG: CopG family antitoxin [Longimicrobiales bacterium]
MRESKLKRIPEFASEAEKHELWAAADPTEYLDWSRACRVVFSRPRPATTPISMRPPEPRLYGAQAACPRTRGLVPESLEGQSLGAGWPRASTPPLRGEGVGGVGPGDPHGTAATS